MNEEQELATRDGEEQIEDDVNMKDVDDGTKPKHPGWKKTKDALLSPNKLIKDARERKKKIVELKDVLREKDIEIEKLIVRIQDQNYEMKQKNIKLVNEKAKYVKLMNESQSVIAQQNRTIVDLLQLVQELASGIGDNLAPFALPPRPKASKQLDNDSYKATTRLGKDTRTSQRASTTQNKLKSTSQVQACLDSSFSRAERQAILLLFPFTPRDTVFSPSCPIVSRVSEIEKICFVVWKCGSRIDEAVNASESMYNACGGRCVQILCVPEEESLKWRSTAKHQLMKNPSFISGLHGQPKRFLVLTYKTDNDKKTSIKDEDQECAAGIIELLKRAGV